MPTGGRDLQRPFDVFLSSDIREIALVIINIIAELFFSIDDCSLQFKAIVKKTDHFCKAVHTVNLKIIHNCSFTSILFRKYQTLESISFTLNSNGKNPFYRLYASIQLEFSQNEIFVEFTAEKLP